MKKIWLIIVFSSLIFLPSCSNANKEISISEPVIAKVIDEKTSRPVAAASIFNENDPAVYFIVKINNLPQNTKIKVSWKHLAEGTEVQSEVITEGTGYEAFTLKRSGSTFPPGQYEVTASAEVDGSILEAKGNFEIAEDAAYPHLSNPVTAKSVDNEDKLNPVDITSEFTQSDPVIYFVVRSKDLPKNTKVSCLWVYKNTGDSLSHELITDGSRSIAFSLKPDGLQRLPAGDYMVTASVTVENKTESVSAEFKIKE